MHGLKRALPLVLVAAVAWLLYRNAELEDTRSAAWAAICGPGAACADEPPIRSERGPFVHSYTWQGTDSLVQVRCRRALWLLGRWECRSSVEPAAVAPARSDTARYPHDQRRGVP